MLSHSLQFDILKEMFNIGVGKSASMLSEIVNKKILLSVPHVELIDYHQQREKHFPEKLPAGTLVISSITFKNRLVGEADLIFPANKMRKFLDLCKGEDSGAWDQGTDFNDIDLDIFKEVGNIILNSIVGELGNFLGISLSYSLPRVSLLAEKDFENTLKDKEVLYRLMLYITFVIDGTEIQGAIIIDLTLNSLQELIKIIKKMEDDLYE